MEKSQNYEVTLVVRVYAESQGEALGELEKRVQIGPSVDKYGAHVREAKIRLVRRNEE